ncbi:toprim domain-containing protein [Bacillus chungangensis]|uniref:DNA primase n=1 Tax=Bacillus chungangensis TaxID=587633 RepID=A0ABT9WMD6_9BACI|nr:toprim domain-containing protein [Bacillus chungangensis]MDQ0174443.1 DNA primase [Bacillus chungangensis]
MPELKIRGQKIDVDIRAELEQFDWGHRASWSDDKLNAASPFRDDQTPSFFVNLDGEYAGTWGDLGAFDDNWRSGGFVKLLSFLRGETWEETAEYLLSEYGRTGNDESELRIRMPNLKLPERFRPLPEIAVTKATSKYLLSRGIDAETQQKYGIGRGQQRGFVAIPWRTPDGQLANIMYRSVRGKYFFYAHGWPIRNLVWGIDVIHQSQAKTAVLVEAPIDALTWASAGVAGIAVGGVNFSDEQADIIKRSPIEKLVLGGDNDAAGRRLNELVKEKLRRHVDLFSVCYGDKKDANACGADVLKTLEWRAETVKYQFLTW